MYWPLLAWSACAHPATVLAGTTFEGAAQASDRLVSMGSATHLLAGTTGESAALANVRLVVVGSASQCGGQFG